MKAIYEETVTRSRGRRRVVRTERNEIKTGRFHYENGLIAYKPVLNSRDLAVFDSMWEEFWETRNPDEEFNSVFRKIGRKSYVIEQKDDDAPILRAYIRRMNWIKNTTLCKPTYKETFFAFSS